MKKPILELVNVHQLQLHQWVLLLEKFWIEYQAFPLPLLGEGTQLHAVEESFTGMLKEKSSSMLLLIVSPPTTVSLLLALLSWFVKSCPALLFLCYIFHLVNNII